MAMNKREQAAYKAMRDALAKSRALAYPTFEKPIPMACPEDGYAHGYQPNSHSMEVRELWASSIRHTTCDPAKESMRGYAGSQGFPIMYATREGAYKAMILEMHRYLADRIALAYERAGIDLVPEYPS